MKILITTNSIWNIINFRNDLIERLVKNNYEIYIITNIPKNNLKYSINKNIKCIDIKLSRKVFSPIKDIISLIQYTYYYIKIKPDLVFSFTVKPNILSSIISKLMKVKHISTVTGLGTHVLKNNILKIIVDNLYKLSLNKNHKIFVHNNYDKKYFINELNFINTKIKRIYGSGVNLEKFKFSDYAKMPKRSINFVFIGRLIADKGIFEFLKCAKIVKKQKKNVNFKIVALVDKNNVSSINIENLKYYLKNNIITYHENEKNIRKFIINASCIVLPSYREGLPRTLLEAIAVGRPIIASNVPGCNDLVKNNFNGFLFKSKNINDFIEKIINFTDLDFENKKKFAYNSYSLAKKFDINIVNKAYINEIK